MSIAEKLVTVAESMQGVYDKGFADGQSQGSDSWYDTFWDTFQQNGNRQNYTNAFVSGNANQHSVGWTNANFKPKYSFDNIVGYAMFDYSMIEGSLSEILNDLGLTLTFKGYQSSGFQSTQFTEINYINNEMSSMVKVFLNSNKLKTLKVGKITTNTKFQNTFDGCSALEDLTLEGVICQNGFDVSQSPLLTKASIENVLSCLSTTTSGLTVTLSLVAVNKAFETSTDALNGSTSDEWNTLIAKHTNWTISLV